MNGFQSIRKFQRTPARLRGREQLLTLSSEHRLIHLTDLLRPPKRILPFENSNNPNHPPALGNAFGARAVA